MTRKNDGTGDRTEEYDGEKGRPFGELEETMAFHEADEEWDPSKHVIIGGGKTQRDYGACRIRIVHPSYKDSVEEFAYRVAVENNPKGENEGSLAYAQRISEIATKKIAGSLTETMPRTRLSRLEQDAQLQKLREQASRAPAGEKEDEDDHPF